MAISFLTLGASYLTSYLASFVFANMFDGTLGHGMTLVGSSGFWGTYYYGSTIQLRR